MHIGLPEARTDGSVSLEQALQRRRSVRDFTDQPIKQGDLAQLLWAAQGITDREGLRTAPSAGGLYPLEVYIVVGHVEDLAPGIYHYDPGQHAIRHILDGDRRGELSAAALRQESVADGALSIVIAAVPARTARKYGQRSRRYVDMEVGHAGQNIILQATALGLAAVTVGAFDDHAVNRLLGLKTGEQALYIVPIGYAVDPD